VGGRPKRPNGHSRCICCLVRLWQIRLQATRLCRTPLQHTDPQWRNHFEAPEPSRPEDFPAICILQSFHSTSLELGPERWRKTFGYFASFFAVQSATIVTVAILRVDLPVMVSAVSFPVFEGHLVLVELPTTVNATSAPLHGAFEICRAAAPSRLANQLSVSFRHPASVSHSSAPPSSSGRPVPVAEGAYLQRWPVMPPSVRRLL
jgi:hypothetical protein